MAENKLEDLIPKEEFQKFERLKELLNQLQTIEGELRSKFNIGLEIIELDHV